MNKRLSLLWFLLGLGSELQLFYSLSFSELIVLVMAPLLLVSELPFMRKHGVIQFFNVAILLFIGCVVSLIVNHAQAYQVLRGVSITGIIVCVVVVGHYMLRKDPNGLKWYFIGVMLSGFICIFIFQKSVEVSIAGGSDADTIMAGPLFWIQRLSALLMTPIFAFYLHVPLGYSVGAPIFMSLFSIFYSSSGRAAALSFIGSAVLVLLGRKRRNSMAALGRHFILLFCCSVAGIFVIKATYQWAVSHNYLGERALEKYERQTGGGSGMLQLLIGGRADSFIGFLAIADSPILGKGYWAREKEKDYVALFLARYGTSEDYENYRNRLLYRTKRMGRSDYGIPCHSHITSFWLWYGLPGLIFWLYVIYVIFRYLRYDVSAVPQWFYWLAASVPGTMWHILFSPFNARIGLPLFVIGMLMARAVRLGKYQLPLEMVYEIAQAERK